MSRITLVGYRGTGKSTVAALIAERLGCGWCDADVVLEDRLGTTIATLVRDRGESAFRDAESVILRDLLANADIDVLATGGGVVLRPENRDLLRREGGAVAWLTAPADVIRARLESDPATRDRRPALSGSDPLAEVDAALAAREHLYREVAGATFDTSTLAPADLARRIVAWVEGRDAGDVRAEISR